MNRDTSRDHIAHVVAIEDRVLRNYWVTQSYADLSVALSALLATGTTNWCTFGTWASRTVGACMRGEAMPAWVRERVLLPDGLMGAAKATRESHGWRRVAHAFDDLAPEHLIDVLQELLGEMSINLSDGNTEVFAEIAPPAATFLEAYATGPVDAAAARAQVLAACEGAPVFEGLNRLASGYGLWCDAMASADPARRSQLILAGSIQLGVHEQNHLQPVIASSMDMGVNQAASRLRQRLAKGAVLRDVETEVDEALRPATRGIGDAWDDLMTATLGTLQSPEGVLRLDHDVPPVAGQPFEPPELDPTVVEDLVTLRSRFDRSSGGGVGSGARNWVNFDDRMNFIANLFISRHRQAALFDPPFDDATLEAMLADRVPTPAVSGSPR